MQRSEKQVIIDGRPVGQGAPFYTIAEIGSNFDGSIERARSLVDLASACGADAVKFQTFKAEELVSDAGFRELKIGYQTAWKDSVLEVYRKAEFPREWHEEIRDQARKKGMAFFSSSYDRAGVDLLEELDAPAHKVGSGDLGNLELIEYMADTGKPLIVATGAAEIDEIDLAVDAIRRRGNDKIVLLQCVTNYPASFDSINARVLPMFADRYGVAVGYSDHTPGDLVALATVCLGGCMIEKHFTDDKTRPGPDHPFAMDGEDFKFMVDRIRTMEKILGSAEKTVYPEENDTSIIMKRSIRAAVDIRAGDVLERNLLEVLRPREKGSVDASRLGNVLGKRARRDITAGDPVYDDSVDWTTS
jgi:N-acetylneuraminate synthase